MANIKIDSFTFSPTEFEELAIDLVERCERIILESFKEGKDQGIPPVLQNR